MLHTCDWGGSETTLGPVQSARSAIQVCQLFRSIIELLGNRALNDPMHLHHIKWNYGVDFQTHSKLEGSERIAEYRGIPVGSNIPPSQIKSVSHCNISTLDHHVGVRKHTCFISCCAYMRSAVYITSRFSLLIISTTTNLYIVTEQKQKVFKQLTVSIIATFSMPVQLWKLISGLVSLASWLVCHIELCTGSSP